jgi:hypothetical protein
MDDEKDEKGDAEENAGEPDERAREEGDQEIILTGRSGDQEIIFIRTRDLRGPM